MLWIKSCLPQIYVRALILQVTIRFFRMIIKVKGGHKCRAKSDRTGSLVTRGRKTRMSSLCKGIQKKGCVNLKCQIAVLKQEEKLHETPNPIWIFHTSTLLLLSSGLLPVQHLGQRQTLSSESFPLMYDLPAVNTLSVLFILEIILYQDYYSFVKEVIWKLYYFISNK